MEIKLDSLLASLRDINLATKLTLARLLLVLPLILLPWINATWPMLLCFVIMLVAAATDYADGWVARHKDQATDFGAMLDQITDKVLVLGALVALLATGKLSWMATMATFIILFREILVSGLREHLALASIDVPVSPIAKWKTATQMLALILLYASYSGFTAIAGTLDVLAEVAFIVAAALTLYTAWDYAKAAAATHSS